MGDTNVNLASLIGSRICHDLISPIGAISNGLELLDLTGAAEGPEMELIADSVGNAGARIRYFRIAYGASGDQGIARNEIVSILDDVERGARVAVDWTPAGPQSRAEVRLVFLALQCLETAMPFGGRVVVKVEDRNWILTGTAEKMNFDDRLWDFSEADAAVEITPATVQFALLPAIAADLGREVLATREACEITVRF